jgi:hypothetical protein
MGNRPMTKLAKRTSLILAALLLAAAGMAVVAPTGAIAQGAEDEYDLELPGSGGEQTTPAPDGPIDTPDEDDDGFPVIGIVLVGAAGVVAGLGLWRLVVGRRLAESDEAPDEDEPPSPRPARPRDSRR